MATSAWDNFAWHSGSQNLDGQTMDDGVNTWATGYGTGWYTSTVDEYDVAKPNNVDATVNCNSLAVAREQEASSVCTFTSALAGPAVACGARCRYGLSRRSSTSTRFSIQKMSTSGGRTVLVYHATRVVQVGEIMRLVIADNGDGSVHLSGYIDGELLLEYDDSSPLDPGLIGLYAQAATSATHTANFSGMNLGGPDFPYMSLFRLP